jgi:hypothetical protein
MNLFLQGNQATLKQLKTIRKLLVGAAVVGIAGVANAIPTLYVSTTGLAGSYTAVAFNASGNVTWSGSAGVWNLGVTTGLTDPALGTPSLPNMNMAIQASSTAAGSLYLAFANNGYTGSGEIIANFSGHVVSGAPETYTFTTFGDSSNIQPTTTLPTGSVITTLSGSLPALASTSGALPLTTPCVLGEIVEINTTGATIASIGATFSPVPDGGMTVAMLGFGLAVVGAVRRKLAKA